MDEELKIEPIFDEDNLPERIAEDGTFLGTYDQAYTISELDGTQVGTADHIEAARLFAAAPKMLKALKAAQEYINDTTTNCRECGEPDSLANRDLVIDMIDDAIAATKGE